jgi:hypothetical protein
MGIARLIFNALNSQPFDAVAPAPPGADRAKPQASYTSYPYPVDCRGSCHEFSLNLLRLEKERPWEMWYRKRMANGAADWRSTPKTPGLSDF